LAKPLRTKGYPLFDEVGDLVDGRHATGQRAFRAGQPTQASSAQNAAASAPYEPVIDPQLLEVSFEKEKVTNGKLDQDDSQMSYI